MKVIPIQIKNTQASSLMKIATLWRLKLNDGSILGFTSFNKDIILEDDSGVVYKARTGFTPSAIQSSEQFNVDNLEVEGFLDDESITEQGLNSGKFDFAEVIIMKIDYSNKPYRMDKLEELRFGVLGEAKHGLLAYQIEIRGLTQFYQYSVGDLFQPGCRAVLGDSKCKVNLATYTFTSSVLSVSDNVNITSSLTNEDDYFTNGIIMFTSGLNNGLKMEVKQYKTTDGLIRLSLPLNYQISVGDTFMIVKGCKNTKESCKTFNNVINYRGEPDMPGMDFLQGGMLQ